jgi:4-oxalomesaconate tautomerase
VSRVSTISGGVIGTRSFIPHRVHESIGVLGAATVAAACLVPGSVAQQVSGLRPSSGTHRLDIEHPTGYLTVAIDAQIEATHSGSSAIARYGGNHAGAGIRTGVGPDSA